MKKLLMGTFTAVLSTGLLFGCGTPNDEQEPDPTEEPSEQLEDENEMDEQEPDLTEEPSEQQEDQNQMDEQEPDPTEEPSEQLEDDKQNGN